MSDTTNDGTPPFWRIPPTPIAQPSSDDRRLRDLEARVAALEACLVNEEQWKREREGDPVYSAFALFRSRSREAEKHR